MAENSTSRQRAQADAPRAPKPSGWRKPFLSELAATSNVAASARAAGVNPSTAYDARRADPEFHRKWQEALCEGYEHLEMGLLHRLREGELKPASGSKRGTRIFDNATAFRLLTMHRESVAKQKGINENRNADAILASLDAKLDKMRRRSLEAAGQQAAEEAGSTHEEG